MNKMGKKQSNASYVLLVLITTNCSILLDFSVYLSICFVSFSFILSLKINPRNNGITKTRKWKTLTTPTSWQASPLNSSSVDWQKQNENTEEKKFEV